MFHPDLLVVSAELGASDEVGSDVYFPHLKHQVKRQMSRSH